MAALMTIVAMPALDLALVVLVLPGAATSSAASGSYGLVLSVYLLGLLTTTPLWGAMGDRYGPRPLLLLGTALFGIGAAGASLSPVSWGLVVSRAIQGIGAGSMQGLTQAVVARRFVDFGTRGRALALLSASWGGAAVLAPAIVKLVPEQSWRAVFATTVPLAVVVLLLFPRVYRDGGPRRRNGPLDILGCLLLLLASACVAVLVADPGRDVALMALALLGLVVAALVTVERRVRTPILPLSMFCRRGLSPAMLSSVALGLVLAVTSTAAPIYSQMVLGSSPSMSGLAYAMLAVAWTASALLTAPMLQSLGVRLTGVLGAATVGVGCLIFILVIVLDGGLWLHAVAGLVVGGGLGPFANAVVIGMQESTGQRNVGAASSLSMMARSLGQSLGVSLVPLAISATVGATMSARSSALADPVAVERGVVLSYSLAAAVALVAMLLILRMTSEPDGSVRQTRSGRSARRAQFPARRHAVVSDTHREGRPGATGAPQQKK